MLKRFINEINVLGRLQHPGIAQIYEAGAADEDRADLAYFAMEFVRGEPLTEFTAARELSTPQCLELMAKICDAVQHAHQRGVVHRDLKPANILIEASGQPKILDFGVARLYQGDADDATTKTSAGELVGTLAYMSPEQVSADPAAIDTRSDVYSLGVLLFEVLARRLPYDLSGKPLPDVLRIIRDAPPPRLATIRPALRGDLDTIVAKAMAKVPELRYGSAAALAIDLRRFLRGEPVEARAPDALYLIGKLVARNRGITTAMALAVVFLIAGIPATSWLALQATRQQRRAESAESAAKADAGRAHVQRERAERTSSFFRQMLASADPHTAQGRDVTVREVLDLAAHRVQADLAGAPEVEAFVRDTIGDTYRSLAYFEQAEAHLRAAVELRRTTPGVDSLELATSLHNLAAAITGKGNPGDAYQYAEEALALRRRALGPAHPQIAESLHLCGRIFGRTGHVDRAETAFREELAIRVDQLSIEDDGVVYCLSRLGVLLGDTYRFAEAERMQSRALALARQLHGDEHTLIAVVGTNFGTLLTDAGRYAEAEPVLRATLISARRFWGDNHPDTARLLLTLPRALHGLGNDAEAEPLLREGLAAWESKFSHRHRTTAEFLIVLSQILNTKGEAAAEEAERVAREAVAVLGEYRTATNAQAESVLGACLVAQGRYAAAEPLLLASYAEIKSAKGVRHRYTEEALERIVVLYRAWGRDEAAREYEARLKTVPEAPSP